MAVTIVRPADWQAADMVEVESDGKDNYAAIIEIENWAQDHGMLRTNEHWLQTVRRPDGRTGRVSICFRPSPVEIDAREAKIVGMQEAARRLAIER